MNFLAKFSLKEKFKALFVSRKEAEEIYSSIEELLLGADIAFPLAENLLKKCRRNLKGLENENYEKLVSFIQEELRQILLCPNIKPFPSAETLQKDLILLVGINGSGKTTSAAKLARFYQKLNKKILLAAADTFRAAGSSQLVLWGEKLKIPVISGERGADPGSVIFNSLQSFLSNPYQLLIADTAGRLQNKEQLLKELEKLYKVALKFLPEQQIHPLLVIDASNGQNALQQALKFNQFTSLAGIILTKIDGTARGGTIISIVDSLKIPVTFVTFGEGFEEINLFNPDEFLTALLK